MQKPYDIECEIISVKGKCRLGHQVGEKFIIKSMKLDHPICTELLHSMMPWMQTLAFGGEIPWDKEGVVIRMCPDTGNAVEISMRAIK